MRPILTTVILASLLLPLAARAPRAASSDTASPDIGSLETRLSRDPYAYDARETLVTAYRRSGDYPSAYYHAAWLAWLAPQRSSRSEAGLLFLRDRNACDRAARANEGPIPVIVAAVRARQRLYDTCLNGAIAHQAPRLRSEIADLLAQAERAEAETRHTDPLTRIALAHLCLTLDDALTFEATPHARRARLQTLRTAAARAAAVAAWLPESPGVHRTLAQVRARLADLDDGSDPQRTRRLWELAIAQAERAHHLDPDDPTLPDLLWAFHLRAGNWPDAAHWQQQVEPTSPE